VGDLVASLGVVPKVADILNQLAAVINH
jgi:hypothetical protein